MNRRTALPALMLCLLVALGAKKPPKVAKPEPPAKNDASDKPLPDPVKATVSEHFPNGAIEGYEHDADDGRQLYFVDISNNGKTITLLASGRGQYLGQILENDDDSGDVFLDLATAPDSVRKGISRHFNVDTPEKADLDNLFMEVESSRFMFIAEKTENKTTQWVTFSAQGKLISVETEVRIKDLPQPVKDAITKAHPAAKIDDANKVEEKEGDKSTHYAIDITDGPIKLELTVTPGGTITTSDLADEDTTKPG